jgi:diguanylate cyclase (GGDEF)-like protein
MEVIPLKISEFAKMNNVTAKMLRHYDEIGLLKPALIDEVTGYRSYKEEQSQYLNWIIILKGLDFSLAQIKEVLSGPVDCGKMINELINKRIEISSALNVQIQKKIEIDKLINILEKEGFRMDKQIDLLNINGESIHEIKKNMPNMEMFLENAKDIASLSSENDEVTVFRFDISHFKQVNDNYGFEVGDKVIVVCYNIIKANMDKHFTNAAIGRAHGDEFVVFARSGKSEAERAAQAIVEDMEAYDFSSIGCLTQMGGYIGGIVGKQNSDLNIRNMIENSIESLNNARRKGKNSIFIEVI